jgi:tRNA pseudouridine55 synthase
MLIIDKPAGWTSHDVVAWVRRWSGERKVGHAGTLDPAATGVLPVAINDGTRILEFLADSSKAYLAEITYGVSTDSADADGTVIATGEVAFSDAELARAIEKLHGEIRQRPPGHSAVKIGGQRAYKLARAGIAVDVPERMVTIERVEIQKWDGRVLTAFIECSKGTYIRSIARDLGECLGSGAYLSNLVRTRSGPYCLADAWTIPELDNRDPRLEWESFAVHPDSALPDWSAIVLDAQDAKDWEFGRPLKAVSNSVSKRCRVYDNHGNWLGLAADDSGAGVWKPLRVIKAL